MSGAIDFVNPWSDNGGRSLINLLSNARSGNASSGDRVAFDALLIGMMGSGNDDEALALLAVSVAAVLIEEYSTPRAPRSEEEEDTIEETIDEEVTNPPPSKKESSERRRELVEGWNENNKKLREADASTTPDGPDNASGASKDSTAYQGIVVNRTDSVVSIVLVDTEGNLKTDEVTGEVVVYDIQTPQYNAAPTITDARPPVEPQPEDGSTNNSGGPTPEVPDPDLVELENEGRAYKHLQLDNHTSAILRP